MREIKSANQSASKQARNSMCKNKNEGNNCIFCWKIWKENKLLVSFWAGTLFYSIANEKWTIKWLKPQTLTRETKLFIAFGRFYLLSVFISCEWSLKLLHLRLCMCIKFILMSLWISSFIFFLFYLFFAHILCHSFKWSVLFFHLCVACVCLARAFAEL